MASKFVLQYKHLRDLNAKLNSDDDKDIAKQKLLWAE